MDDLSENYLAKGGFPISMGNSNSSTKGTGPTLDSLTGSEQDSTSLIWSTYLKHVADVQHFLDTYDPYTTEPLKSLTNKIDCLLKKYANMTYSTFVKQTDPSSLSTDTYAIMESRIKRQLFDYRARVYLSALADSEAEGYKLDTLLEIIAENEIPYVKKMKTNDEPTFQKIYALLHSSQSH